MSPALHAAIAAAAAFPAPPPVPAVEYASQGRVLIIADGTSPLSAVARIAASLPTTLLLTDDSEPADADYQVQRGTMAHLTGWLGAFSATWHHAGQRHAGKFDLVLNLTAHACFSMHQPPQGYFAPDDDAALQQAIAEILDGVGTFEKPRFFAYDAGICAHSRSHLEGCDKCITVCSTEAIRPDGDRIQVEPHLCMGCGACASVCPSGAMRYNFPAMSYWGGKLKAILGACRDGGGHDATLLLHNPADGAELVQACALPDHVIPLEVFHVASIGLDWLLGAVALGAGRVAVLAAGSEAPQYLAALREQMALGETLLNGLGYGGHHFTLIDTRHAGELASALQALPGGAVPPQPAGFNLFDEKRTTLDFCFDHFVRHSPAAAPDSIALPAGAPYGAIAVDGQKCTLCLSCVGACPEKALMDGDGAPMLKFVERNCVQCGLCENACPEDAITLQPRLLLTPQAKQPRVLHQDQPFHCVRCGKPFATTHMVGSILSKLSGHSMFATPEARRRLQMCGDCRVVDMMSAEKAAAGGPH